MDAKARSFKHQRIHFQKQICLLTGKASTITEGTNEFFFTNLSLTLAFSKGSHFPWQAFSCSKAKYNWAGRERILTGCARLVAEVTHAIVEWKFGDVWIKQRLYLKSGWLYSVVFEKVVARWKFNIIVQKQQFEDWTAWQPLLPLQSKIFVLNRNWLSAEVSGGARLLGESYFFVIHYSFLQALILYGVWYLMNVVEHDFGGFLLVRFCTVRVDAFIIIHTYKIQGITKENFFFTQKLNN